MNNILINDRKQLFRDELRSYRTRPINPIRNNPYHKTGTISRNISRKSRPIYPCRRFKSYGISDVLNIISDNISPIDFQPSINYEEKIIKLEPKYGIEEDIKTLHSLHDELTDKKILGTITLEEEIKLEHIRNELESQDNISRIDFYKTKIDKYQEILNKINELENLLK
ncbi:MAG: hypothetical protein U9P81_03175 [Euryarchaeota archaeon]|nr:hypothetical protein [Euryarchaeota archaeon]